MVLKSKCFLPKHLLSCLLYTSEQQGEYGDVSIRFSMQSKDAACYFGNYEEDWEVRAVYNPMCSYDPDTDKVVDYDARPYSRGWCHSESSEIIIGNMEINKDNRVKEIVVHALAGTVHIIVDSDKTHTLLREQHFRVKPYLQVVSP